MPITVSAHRDVLAVLADPRFVPPPVPPDQPPGTIGWLRASVARFSSREDHRRRRTLATAELAALDPATLRGLAMDRTRLALNAGPIDLMARVARVVPVELLALDLVAAGPGRLAVERPVAELIAPVARAYQPGTGDAVAADAALALLVTSFGGAAFGGAASGDAASGGAAFGGAANEETAARIGLLVQAYDATAGLIGNAAVAMLRLGLAGPAEGILLETLRHDPPVRATVRVATTSARVGAFEVPAGGMVRLDFAAANRDPAVFADPDRFDPERCADQSLTLGAEPRPCPGRDHALAIAAGVLDALRGCRLVETEIEYLPSATLRAPARLLVRKP